LSLIYIFLTKFYNGIIMAQAVELKSMKLK